MNPKFYNIYFTILLAVSALAVIFVFSYFLNTLTLIENSNFGAQARDIPKEKPSAQTAKGLYLTAYSAGNPQKVDEIISLLNKTELNAVVIDIKDYSGKILYNSQLFLVKKLGTSDNRLGDAKSLVKKFHDNHIYVIARQTVFQDPILAEKMPGWAIKSKSGEVWRDKKGLSWVDPSKKEVWNYNLAIAHEAIRFGFDEINLDYARFPSDGDMSQAVYSNGSEEKSSVMRRFYRFISGRLKDEPVWLSFDVFGFVMERYDGMSIGQRLQDTVDNADYICPMMYPSHYPANHLGFANPAEHPAEIIENGIQKGLLYFKDKRAKLRPWIQAFDLGAVYSDGAKIREQIDAVEKYTDAGWLMWNAGNRYTNAGLKVSKLVD